MHTETEANTWLKGNTVFIDLAGDINVLAEEKLQQAYELACSQNCRGIIMNFSRVEYINSSGIALIIRHLVDAHERAQKLALIGLSTHYQKIFRMVGLGDQAKFYDNSDDAIRSWDERKE